MSIISFMVTMRIYGDKKKPSKEDLEGVDILVYDIQDVGLRYYTFIYTMAYCMQAAAEKHIPFVVLDRPNPLGAKIISGACIIPELASFVGAYELPVRYGLTCGELGAYFKKYDKLDLDYRLIEMKNYTRFGNRKSLYFFSEPWLYGRYRYLRPKCGSQIKEKAIRRLRQNTKSKLLKSYLG